ncbi:MULTISPECIES: 4-phosphoerythronate dehydrogenase [unclassified Marinobacterium]|uniref:4-phosphoerythronate dehydrogenase n=1 Tax=unclassified Marinobacterium TaxID=2644139 RepID=UPI0015685184|nr:MULTISPECIES: 4-phosphoerythronate dehydrogenase [unclassified Marinobacterium]NRP52715.1 Erythronate-4-phosphate dehydrogenase [Marinobacterium sp. xm-v-242]NRP77296.1 Erythronate-4-phosphate dehydrogenase [Marinobacterium sp. xm-m-383]
MIKLKKVIVADENMPAVEALFSSFGEVRRVAGRSIEPSQLADADTLLVRSITQVNAQLLSEAKPLEFIGSATIGMDHMDSHYLTERAIPFTNAAGCNADSVVDYALAAIYEYAEQRALDPLSLSYGVVGAGNVGSRLVSRLTALGVNVLVSDPPRALRDHSFIDTPLAELMAQSDAVCCHLPLTTSGEHATHHLIGESLLQQLSPGALLLNAGRGPTIDGEALLKFAKQRTDVTLVMDVWEEEPTVDRELACRVLIGTPHIAGYSLEGKLRGTYMLYERYCEILGLEVSVSFDSLFIDYPTPMLELTRQTTVQQVIQSVYSIKEDHQHFMDSLTPAKNQPKAFDQLRKSYPVRREFSSLKLTGQTTGAMKVQLAALGFKVDEVQV